MKYKLVTASVLDFPRKTLPKDLWVYENPEDLPKLKPELKNLIMENVKRLTNNFKLPLEDVRLIGGSASYQWSVGTDLDIFVLVNWPQGVTDDKVADLQKEIKNTDLKYEGYPINFHLAGPKEGPNVTEAEYDVTDNEWTLPPLVLPQGFDPDNYFAPLIKVAENRAKKFDGVIGELRRAWHALKKSSEAKKQARDKDVVEKSVVGDKKKVKGLVEKLARDYNRVWESRNKMHEELKAKMAQDVEIGRFERFQEPEIIWKYLDRAGYIDYLKQIWKLIRDEKLDDVLAKY